MEKEKLLNLSMIVNGKKVSLSCEPDTPILYMKEALARFLKHCLETEDQMMAEKKKREEEQKENEGEELKKEDE